MKINDTLKLLRQSKGLTQSDIAERINMSLSSYQKYEREKNSVIPSLDVLIRLADFYGVSVDYLLGREPPAAAAFNFNPEKVEERIIENYKQLDEETRMKFLDFLQKLADEPETENPPKVAWRKTIGEIEAERKAAEKDSG